MSEQETKDTDQKQSKPWQFKPGQSGNPKGRPKGARSKLGEAFLADLLHDWEAHGAAALAECRETKPDAYIKTVASILPKELNVKVDPYEEMSDDELDRAIKRLAAEVLGVSAASGTKEETDAAQQAGDLSALH